MDNFPTQYDMESAAHDAAQYRPAPAVHHPVINISTRKVGGIRFLKLGRFCFAFCVTKKYTPL